MPFLHYFFAFLVGAFACNSIPHLASGLRGEPFPTPFAKPPGVGRSSPLVNVWWGWANLLGAAMLLSATGPIARAWSAPALCMAAGFLAVGTHLAWHFGRVMQGGAPRQ